MDPIARFLAYAAAFEEAYATEDWSKLDPFFTADAVYTPLSAFGADIKGREAIKAALAQMCKSFDKRFASRTVELLAGPEMRDGAVWLRWKGIYTLDGAPPLHMIGEETAAFDGDRIRHLSDTMDDAEARKIQAYVSAHGDKLKDA
jgi:hypothetical protein